MTKRLKGYTRQKRLGTTGVRHYICVNHLPNTNCNLVPRVSHLPAPLRGGKMRDPGNEVALTGPLHDVRGKNGGST